MKNTLLSLGIAALVAGCQTISSALPPKKPPTQTDNITVQFAAGEHQHRLNCYREEQASPFCALRIYQVMVEAFIDGDANADFNTAYGTSHHKGDLAGITQSLDYISSLGFNAIWLTPIFHSVPLKEQEHWTDRLDATGYFASNFFAIDPRFGSLDQARKLVDEAHKRGMYVFLDGVFGHFKENAVNYPSPSGRTLSTAGKRQSTTGHEAIYPKDLEFFKEVASYWIKELKIDGWRLDQAYQVPVEYWREIRKTVEDTSASVYYIDHNGNKVNPLGYMVAEIWNSASYITQTGYGSDELPALQSAFDFPVQAAMSQTFGSDKEGNHSRPAANLDSALNLASVYPDHAIPNLMLGNHDFPRFGNLLQRARLTTPDSPNYWARHKAAFSFMAAYSGPITLYYNEETGDAVNGFIDKVADHECALQGLCDDHAGRTTGRIEGLSSTVGGEPVVLNDAEKNLKAYVSSLMAMRAKHPALYAGSRTHIFSNQNLFIDRKNHGDDHVLYMVNVGSEPETVYLLPDAVGSKGRLNDLIDDTRHSDIVDGYYSITLAPMESRFYAIEQPATIMVIQQVEEVSDRMAACNLPDADGAGPLNKAMWIRGSYKTGDGFMATPSSRRFSYKGDNLYQVVVFEPERTAFTFKFASKDWSSEYAVERSAGVKLGTIQTMSKAAGPGTESSVVIPEAGYYVYSFRINGQNGENQMYIGRCQ